MKFFKNNEKWSDIISLALWFVIIAGLFFLSIVGAYTYELAVKKKNENDHVRETLSYIQTKADGSTSVTLRSGDMLCFSETDPAYETKLYVQNGTLTEELSEAGEPKVPSKGQAICSVESFSAEAINENTILVTVDGKCAYICKEGSCGE